MKLIQFLQDLSLQGVKLWIDGDKLRTEGSQKILNSETIAQLKQNKLEIVKILSEHQDIFSIHSLSYGQQGLWFLWQILPQSSNYNVSFAVRIYSRVDISAWQSAFELLKQRHPLLRSTFPKIGEQPIQKVHQNQKLDFWEIDATIWTEEELCQKVVQFHQQPFNLETDPVMRVRWFTCSDENHVMLLTIHHIAWDGWSANLIVKELPKLYQAQKLGLKISLPPLKSSYQDYVNWQRELIGSSEGKKLWHYWKQKLAGELPILNLPTDKPRSQIKTDCGNSYSFELSENLTQKLKELSKAQGVTLYTTLLSAFQVLLYRYTGQDDILVGSPTSGRTKIEFQSIVGYFVNSVVLRTDLSKNPTFIELLTQVRQTVIEALAHQDYPFALIVEQLMHKRNPSYSPVFQAYFALQNFLESEDLLNLLFKRTKSLVNWGDLKVQPFVFNQYENQYDLFLEMLEQDSCLIGYFKYDSHLFNEDTIMRMEAHFRKILQELVYNPKQRVGHIDILSQEERLKILVEWNKTKTDYPSDQCIHTLFESQVNQNPESIAVIFADEKLTYSQLNIEANKLAYNLKELGITPGVMVGICIERSVEMVISMLAILKAGGIYVPLDPNYPPSRLSYMVEDAQISMILTQKKCKFHLPKTDAQIIELDLERIRLNPSILENSIGFLCSEQDAYMMYTSGSTGKPKGVKITHKGVVRLVKNTNYISLTTKDVLLQLAPISFDASTFEIWGSLLNGGTLAIMPPHQPSLTEIGLAIKKFQVTTLWMTAGLFHVMVEEQLEDLKSIRQLLAGGDILSLPHVKKVIENLDECQLINGYGPTENTTFTCCFPVTARSQLNKSVPIGRPISNTQVYILDSYLQPVPIGVPGELYIGGDGLSTGYHHQEELTLEKFIDNPFDPSGSAKLYKTGDLVRYLCDGNIEFLGRIDHQIKIRGFRIETGEVETILNQHPRIKETVVVTREDYIGKKSLVAYIVPKAEMTSNSQLEYSDTQVQSWQDLFNQKIYDRLAEYTNPLFNTAGWLSSYNQQPIPEDQMRIWANDIVTQVLAHRPERVWEVGCGTGMLLFQIAPHTQEYYGTDVSQVSLKYIQQQIAQYPEQYSHVTLEQKQAENMADIPDDFFDVVILSSIVQYFPSIDYLLKVIEQAIRVVKPGGLVFLGDVRNYSLMEAFHASVQLYQTMGSLSIQKLREKIFKAIRQEHELLVSPELFVALQNRHQKISHVQIRLQRGKQRNEMNQYRYHVLLHIQKLSQQVITSAVVTAGGMSQEEIENYLRRNQPLSICFRGLVNSRIESDVRATKLLSTNQGIGNVEELMQKLEEKNFNAVDPESLYELSAALGYCVELCWSLEGKEECFDAVLVRSNFVHEGIVLTPLTQKVLVSGDYFDYGNNPLASQVAKQLIPQFREYLKEQLPEYMIPSAFVILSELPLTANGKVDRRALPQPDSEGSEFRERVLPQTPVEVTLAKIWQEVLGIEEVSIHSNFFEVGGDSIVSIQIATRAQKAGIQLTTKQVFQYQTIAEQAKIALLTTDETHGHQQGFVTGKIPLTPIQYWFFEQNISEIHHFNQSLLLSVSSDIDVKFLSISFQKLLEHHDVLRLRFYSNEQGWCQFNAGLEALDSLEVIDLSEYSEGTQPEVLESIANERQASLNLIDGPLIRVVLFKWGQKGKASLLIIIHHLAIDGVSWRILLEDLWSIYEQLEKGELPQLPAKTTSFQDWSICLQDYAQSESLRQQMDYWLNSSRLSGVSLPVDYPGFEGRNTVGDSAQVKKVLSIEATRDLLQQVPALYNTQINDVLLTALGMTLMDWIGSKRVLIHLEGHGREELFEGVDLSRTVGWFTSLFPVELKSCSGEIGEWIKSVKEQLREIPERGIGYGILRYLSGDKQIKNQLAGLPEPEVSFNYLGQFNSFVYQSVSWQGAWESAGANQSSQANRVHLLDVNAWIVEGELQVVWTYNPLAHKDSTIEGLAEAYLEKLQKIVAHCQLSEEGSYTPSDFPGVDLNQEELDDLLAEINEA